MTSSLFVNDHSENRHLVSLVQTRLEALLMQPNNKTLEQLLHEALRWASYFFHPGITNLQSWARFIACFSSSGDDLALWRGYGTQSTGVAIEFDPTRLVESGQFGCFWSKCEYEEARQLEYVDSWLVPTIQSLEGECSNQSTPEMVFNNRQHSLSLLLIESSTGKPGEPYYKHRAFASEAEWRLCSPFTLEGLNGTGAKFGKLSFRSTDNALIPYVQLRFPENALRAAVRSIRLRPGSGSGSSLLEDSIRLFSKRGPTALLTLAGD